MTWLVETFVWTGALIALVLAARRPVARLFGARAAYALWVLPLLRLVLPPIVLPEWFAPQASAARDVAVALPDGGRHVATEIVVPAAASATPAIDWLALGIAVWLGGALVHVAIRLTAYARLRSALLAGARPVGEAGPVRLIESPATAAPLAFGVFDKVVALPPGFMASPDRAARDLALAHELAHHRAHDLAANFAALPLFALHWFNPLSWLGWRAMRRDQEAACDARVVAHRDRAERALYAGVIAGFARAPRGGLTAALAAPMACPVLGDKSIVHRLRTLTMTDLSDRRRRAGLLLVGAAALALPLTASITYAQDAASNPPAPPAPPTAIAAPLPPVAPANPLAPEAPLPPVAGEPRIVIDEGTPDGTRKERRVMVFRSAHGDHPAKALGAIPHVERRIVMRGKDGKMLAPDSPEFKAHMERFEREMEGLGERIEKSVVIDEKRIERMAARAAEAGARAESMAPRVIESCAGSEGVSETRSADGKRVIRICQARFAGHALNSLKAARNSIAANGALSAEVRSNVLGELDREIAQLEADK